MGSQRSRRNFLGDLVRGKIPDEPPPVVAPNEPRPQAEEPVSRRRPKGGYHLRLTRRAMASEFQVILNLGQYEHGTEAALEALDLLEPLEEMMSFFRPQGELGRINALAATVEVPVSEELWNLLVWCREMYQRTEGAFDITAAALWQTWGFARREGRLPSVQEIAEARRSCGWEHIQLEEARRTIRFLQPGIGLNLGSVGKGYALDRMAVRLSSKGIEDFVLHGGLSSVLAKGQSWELDAKSGEMLWGWPIGLAHPLKKGQQVGQLRLCNQGLGTSGTALQFFYHKGKRYGHIIDPRTGYPVDDVLSVVVFAPTATEADALATAFFILGPERSTDFCESHPQVSAVFMMSHDRSRLSVRKIGKCPASLETS
ncbi:MAG: FAD:protein FMN transferase [Thermogutta sp.]